MTQGLASCHGTRVAFRDSDPLEEVTLPAWSVIGTFQDL